MLKTILHFISALMTQDLCHLFFAKKYGQNFLFCKN